MGGTVCSGQRAEGRRPESARGNREGRGIGYGFRQAVKSQTLPSFWKAYVLLPDPVKQAARKAYFLWRASPFHPSLHFKCVNQEERVWSVRVSLGYRALGLLNDDTITWFWIGAHDEYDRQL